jgi:subtilisin family serine protease
MAVKGLDDSGYGLDSQLAAAIVYAADNGADVINASWGGTGASPAIEDAIDYATSLGVVFVAAAGNNGEDARSFYPAAFAKVITVAASDATDALAYFSNRGPKIDVAAPGVDILSLRAQGTSRGSLVGDLYTRLQGTSMAAPHVAGLAALVLSRHPSHDRAGAPGHPGIGGGRRPAGFDTDFGYYGRIDAAQALRSTGPWRPRSRAAGRCARDGR